jgi:hypothetical protein
VADATTFISRMSQDDSQAEVHAQQRRRGIVHWQPIWDESTRLQKFANGDQWPEGDKRALDGQQRKVARLVMDRVGTILQTFSGKQTLNRFERGYIARHPSAARQAEVMTAVDHAMMLAANAEQVESAAFKDGPGIQGISAIRWELDTLNERGGGILLTDLPIWNVMADPDARKVNLDDRSWHCYAKWMPQTEVRRRWPEQYEKMKAKYGQYTWRPAGGDATDGGPSSRIAWTGMAGNRQLQPYYPRGQSWWVEYKEWREVVTHYHVGVPIDVPIEGDQLGNTRSPSYAEALSTATEDADTIEKRVFKSKSELDEFKRQWPAAHDGETVPDEFILPKDTLQYKYAYLCGDVELESGPSPTGYWTIQFLTGFRFPLADKVQWKSLMSRLVDPQKWVNVFISALTRNVQVNPKGALFVEEGFFSNFNEAQSAWASPGGVIKVRRGAISSGQKGYDWVQGGSNAYSALVESMLTIWKDVLPEMAGFNPGALGQLGSDLRRISGEVVRQVGDAAMTSNAEPFDAYRLHRREGGIIFLSFLRAFFEVEDLVEIVGEEVAYETVTQPRIDPTTGQPVRDPLTGEVLKEPVIDPATGEPQRQLAIPAKESWNPAWFRDIAIEDTVPSGDQLQVLWKSLETSIQILLTPQADTGMPLFSSEDLAEIIPGIPANRREKMLQRIRAAIAQKQMMPPPTAGGEQAPQEGQQ